ncbi:hypothetical protein [Staphylococcus sp. EZ-P03]|uniref:hypothetical protein n=1 Tax=Staphylococcus sp. EZ-P03 TaxID=2282739 RepID=UPI000DF77C42|nr:hypothetical protein [Staphylococcus sp. EZ-P03]
MFDSQRAIKSLKLAVLCTILPMIFNIVTSDHFLNPILDKYDIEHLLGFALFAYIVIYMMYWLKDK